MSWPKNEQRINGGKTGYKDRDGVDIEFGDVVAQHISINREFFKGFSFATYVVTQTDDGPIISGVHTYGLLEHAKPSSLKVIKYDTDLRRLSAEFNQMRREEGEED